MSTLKVKKSTWIAQCHKCGATEQTNSLKSTQGPPYTCDKCLCAYDGGGEMTIEDIADQLNKDGLLFTHENEK